MSYRKKHYDDGVKEFMYALIDFVPLSHHLLDAKTSFEFKLWLDKLNEIDRRSLILFIKKNKDKINPAYIHHVKNKLGRRFYDI